ncbi:MAG: hypothetical protein WA908_01465 [Pontixanthobacter sp.]
MTAVTLPRLPAPRDSKWTELDFGGSVQGSIGGSSQRINRLGNRWQVEIVLPTMDLALARSWSQKLLRGRRKGILWPVRQMGIVTGSPGAPVVNSSEEAGDQLRLRGLQPGYVLRTGQAFSLVTGGRRYIYKVAEPQRADASGRAVVEINPPLRAEPMDGDAVEIARPFLQGMVEDMPADVDTPSHLTGGFTFTIAEQR